MLRNIIHNKKTTKIKKHKKAERLNETPQTENKRNGQALKLLRIALKDYLPLVLFYIHFGAK